MLKEWQTSNKFLDLTTCMINFYKEEFHQIKSERENKCRSLG